MAGSKQRDRGHGWGRVLVDAAVMVADGGEAICDIDAMAAQPQLFGEVASPSTLWRALAAAGDRVEHLKAARAEARRAVWAAGGDPGFYVIDIDATLVDSHSDKQAAAGTYKGGYGFHPLMAYLDATGECLAAMLRPGNAGSNTASDHIEVLGDALAQIPVDPQVVEVTVRADSAGCTQEFLKECRELGVRFCVGHPLTIDIAQAITEVPDECWQQALTADGTELRDHTAWLQITMCAHDLLAWFRRLALDGDLARAEPKRLRHCLLHTAARLVRTGRQNLCKLSQDWPWTPDLLAAHQRIHNLPLLI